MQDNAPDMTTPTTPAPEGEASEHYAEQHTHPFPKGMAGEPAQPPAQSLPQGTTGEDDERGISEWSREELEASVSSLLRDREALQKNCNALTSRLHLRVETTEDIHANTAYRGVVKKCGQLQTSLAALQRENEGLRESVKTANANHEHFEREWYLRGDEIEVIRADLAAKDAQIGAITKERDQARAGLDMLDGEIKAAVARAEAAERQWKEDFEVRTALLKERDALAAWKESALREWPDLQRIGKLLGMPLGKAIGPKIAPGIERIQAMVETCREALEVVVVALSRKNYTEIDGLYEAYEKARAALADLPVAGSEGGGV